MGLPEINISFQEAAINTIKRGSKGVVVLVLNHSKENAEQSTHTLYRFMDLEDLSIELTEKQKSYIELAFLGGDNPPEKVILVMRAQADTTYTKVFKLLDTMQFTYLAFPEMNTELNAIKSWIKSTSNTFITIIANSACDDEKVVNFTSNNINTNLSENVFTTIEFTSRIAGLLAGTPLNKSATYAHLPEVEDFTQLSKAEMDNAINNGEFILYYDGTKTKVGRAITSFTSVGAEKSEQFKKIKIVEAMHLIKKDIQTTCEDTYIGKYTNTYSNKCILITAINNYFDSLARDNVLNPDMDNICEINIEEQRTYLKSIGVDVDTLSDDEIKRYDTRDKVFLQAKIYPLDAIEEISLEITI